ncbi:MAG: D-cysteine desulfhydrase [Trueperaceae bacterium]|nr:MAG: D-cysteine desulfhydrase [Trueperaceae bacterium]
MHLARFPRRRYTPFATPIEKLEHLSSYLAGPEIYVKRDDLLGLAAGGNKTRKLEFLVADALAIGADTLITVGAVQSNHCRLTLAAAVKEGLKCRLVIEERVPGSYHPNASGNNFLFKLLGVEQLEVVSDGTDLSAAMQRVVQELETEGRKGYPIPGGGSNALGALGYVSCAEEILHQTFDMGLELDHIVTSSGSGGTHSGLVAGMHGNSAGIPVTGISVRFDKERQAERIHALAEEASELTGVTTPVPRESVVVLDDYVGPGYSLPTEAMVEAIQVFARLEGLLLDPVYTGKAAAGLIDLVRRGRFERGEKVLFMHTGGSPALYHYQETILD